jgi:hypothetical protein
MNQENELAGQSIPYWTYADIGLFFLDPAFISVALRLTVPLRFLAHEDFTTPSLAFQLATLSFLLSTLYGVLNLRLLTSCLEQPRLEASSPSTRRGGDSRWRCTIAAGCLVDPFFGDLSQDRVCALGGRLVII